MDTKSKYTREKLLKVAEQASTAAKPHLTEVLTEAADHIAQLEAKLAASALRDEFAKAAMPIIFKEGSWLPSAAEACYQIADAMLTGRLTPAEK